MLACLLQTTHQDAIASLQADMQQAKEAHEALQQQLAAQQEAAAQQQEQVEALQATLADVQVQLGEFASLAVRCVCGTLAACILLSAVHLTMPFLVREL
jgi:predicted  nucleic acid-binding Zn-ribbon protein